jgi:hypothetical protein
VKKKLQSFSLLGENNESDEARGQIIMISLPNSTTLK